MVPNEIYVRIYNGNVICCRYKNFQNGRYLYTYGVCIVEFKNGLPIFLLQDHMTYIKPTKLFKRLYGTI